MKYCKWIIHFVLLFTVPSIALYPQANISVNEAAVSTDALLSYDDMLNLVDDLEDGELEKRCSQEDLERINHFLANLATQGLLPHEIEEELILENDIQELLHEESNPYSFSYGQGSNHVMFPPLFYGQVEVILCKSWLHKKWNQTKKFVKKHKKAIIIGAAVVVTAIVVVGVVAVASTAGATAAGAAASGVEKEEEKPKAKEEQAAASAMAVTTDAPILKTALEEHISTFKEDVAEETLLEIPNSEGHEDAALGEQVRNLGANLAHKTLEGISSLASSIPQLCEEIKDVGQRIIPEKLLSSLDKIEGAPLANYEKLIAEGHEKIDQIFSTEQAGRYTPEAKEARDQWAVGVISPPGIFGGTSLNINKLTNAGRAFDRAGYTKAGRGLMKHGYRPGSVFPKPTGNPEQVNAQGQEILESILNHPEKKVFCKDTTRFGEIMDIHAPGIGGVRFNSSEEMVCFLEPRYE